MELTSRQGHELAYLLGDLSNLAKEKGGEYIIHLRPSGPVWHPFHPSVDEFDPKTDILIS